MLSIKEAIHEFISLKREVLEVTAGTLSVISDWSIAHIQKITNAQVMASQSFDSFYVGDIDGTSLVFAPSYRTNGQMTRAGVNYKDRDYYKLLKKTKRTSFGKVKLGRQSQVPNIHVAVPIYNDLKLKERGELKGYITAGIKPAMIELLIKRMLQGSSDRRAILVERDHRVISDSKERLPILTQLPESSIFSKNCVNDQGYFSVDLKGNPIRVMCANFRFETINWVLWMSTPRHEIQQTASRAKWVTLQTAGLLLFIVSLVAGLLSIMIDRLLRLISTHAQRVARGDFQLSLPPLKWYTPREIIEVAKISLQTLKHLKESDQKVRRLIEDLKEVNTKLEPFAEAWRQVSEAIEILNEKGETLFVNPAFRDLLSLKDDALGSVSTLFSLKSAPLDSTTVGEIILRHAQSGLSWSSEVEIDDDRIRQIHEIYSSPVFDEDDQLTLIIVIRRDLTSSRAAQASAAQNDRLASIGTLAAGMAHEINNPLTYIRTSLDLIQDTFSERDDCKDEELDEAIEDAIEGVERVSEIVRNLLSIARTGGVRGESEEMAQVELSEMIHACAHLMRPKLKNKVEVLIEISPKLSIYGRRSELIQVILNLFINASQAMPVTRLKGNVIDVKATRTEDSLVMLTVSDNGTGIPERDLPHIFAPFFTSKPTGQGTGLGLAVSRGIIESHHGKIVVSSKDGEGTLFTLTFPHYSPLEVTQKIKKLPASILQEIDRLDAGQASSSNIGSSETALKSLNREPLRILIVDDDERVAKSLSRLLKGERVQYMNGGERALLLLESMDFDLILSDVMMPGMNGPELYERLLSDHPEYRERVIFITGAARGSDIEGALRETNRLVLNKPITRTKLLLTIEDFLKENRSDQ